MLEYLTHAIPLVPGSDGATTEILNQYAAEGWRVLTAFPVPARAPGSLLEGRPPGLGLFVVLERPKAAAPADVRVVGAVAPVETRVVTEEGGERD